MSKIEEIQDDFSLFHYRFVKNYMERRLKYFWLEVLIKVPILKGCTLTGYTYILIHYS